MSHLAVLLYAFCLASSALTLSFNDPDAAARRSTGKPVRGLDGVARRSTGEPEKEEAPAARRSTGKHVTDLDAAALRSTGNPENEEASTVSGGSGGAGGLVGLLQLFSAENIEAVQKGKIPEVIRSHIPADLLKALENLKPRDLDGLKTIAVDQLLTRKYSSVRKLLAAIKEKAPEVHAVIKQGLKTGAAVLKKIESDVGPKVWGNVVKTYNAARDVAKTAAQDYLKLDSKEKASLKAKFPYSLLVELFDDPLFGSFYNLIVNDGKQIKA